MKNLNFILRLGADDEYKLNFISDKTGLNKSEVIRILINIMFHDVDPPFREFSS